MGPLSLIWLLPALPLAGAALIGLLGSRLPRSVVGLIAPGTVGASFLLATWLTIALVGGASSVHSGRPVSPLDVGRVGGGYEQLLWDWVPPGTGMIAGPRPLRVAMDLRFDGLAALMVLTVTFVAFWIHVFSIGYMGGDPGFARYFSYLNLFVAFMLVLVLGASLPVLFVGWEGVGLCSYLLIGFWYREKWPQDAAVKAFVVNRIGDFAFLLGMLWIFSRFKTLHIATVLYAVGGDPGWAGSAAAFAVPLLLFGGAVGKSAQIPLYVWLPDAMAGPTPVSALIHAATMVTAGVYMVVRHAPLYLASPGAMTVVAVVGAATALWAALFGLAAREMKQVLAYSTISQLGYMFLGLGVGAFGAGIFHLVTHAFFKALLFLGAGAVMHSCADVQDLDRIGGLRHRMPWTHLTFWAGCLALAGIFPFAGFWSKDAILYGAWTTQVLPPVLGRVLWGVGSLAAVLTAFYTFRLLARTFWGPERVPEGAHPHEAPAVMSVPLGVLAAGALLAGCLQLPFGGPETVTHLLAESSTREISSAGAVHHATASSEAALLGFALLIALCGAGLAWWVYSLRGGEPARRAAASLPGTFRWLRGAGYVDLALWGWIAYPYRRACAWLGGFDRLAVDGTVRMTGFGVEVTGLALRFIQTGRVRSYVFLVFGGALLVALYCFLAS